MSKKKDWKDPKDYLIEAYTNKLINDYKQDDEKEQERQRQRALSSPSTSVSTNSSTTSQKSSYGSQAGSQTTPAERDLFKITGRRHTVTDRRRGIDKNEKTQRTANISGQNRGLSRDDNDRFTNTIKGAGKQWLGGQLSGIGTTAQADIVNINSIRGARAERENDYRLTSREEAEKREAESVNKSRTKDGVNLRDMERRYSLEPEGNVSDNYRKIVKGTQSLVNKGDSLIESGTQDIEKAKEGATDFEKFLIDNGAQLTQWAGDASLRLIPVVGQALSMGGFFNRAGGMSAYQGRQEGMNPDQQFKYYAGSGLMEVLSELTFQSVGALRATYGKGMFSIADKLTTKASTSGIVNRLLNNTELGKSLFINMARLGGNAVEEGLEEVETDLVDPLLKYYIKKSEDPRAEFEGWDLKQMGYDFLMGATMGGVLGVAEVPNRVKYELNIANSDAFNDGMATSLIKQASVQGRQSDGGRLIPTNAELLAQQLQQQMDNNIPVQPAQIRMLQEAIGQSISENQKQLTRRMTEEYDKAQKSGDLVQMEGTRLESQGIDNASVKLYDDATEKARQVLGEDATQEEVEAVAGVTTGLASTNEIDAVLVKPELKKAVETIVNEGADAESAVSIPVNNAEARDVLENLTAVKRIANRNTILKDVQAKNAEIIKSSVDNMSEGGKNLFASRAEFAQDTIGGNRDRNLEIYRDRFSRLYTDGNTKGADFETSYKRIIGSLDSEALKSVFTEDFARQIFEEGKKAIVTNTAKETAKSRAEEYANRKGGLTFENNNENLISSREKDELQKFAERVGVEINVVKTLAKDASGKALMSRTGKKLVVNGKYQDGVITIASDAQNKLITVAKHELTHHLKETSPEMYQKLEDFVFERWYHGNAEEMEDEIARYTKLYSGQGLDRDGVREEIIADASEAFFTDEGAIQDAISFSEKLGRAIHDGIKTMLDAFLGLQDADSRRMRGYGGFLKDLGILQEAERMWLEALEDTQQRKRNARGNADQVLGRNDSIPTREEVSNGDATYGGIPIRYDSKLEAEARNFTSEVHVSDKFFNQPESVQRSILNHEVAHNLSDELMGEHTDDYSDFASKFIKEKEYSKNSDAYRSGQRTYWEGLYGDIGATALSETVTRAITEYLDDPQRLKNRSAEAYNEIDSFMKEATSETGEKLSVTPEEDQAYMDAVNKGDMETAQKMVDEEAKIRGYALKAYHGTKSEPFNVFDRSRVSHGRMYGDGFYFSPYEDIAGLYGTDIREYYIKTGAVTGDDLDNETLAITEYKDIADKKEALDFYRSKVEQFKKYGQGIERFRPSSKTINGKHRITYTTVGVFDKGNILVVTEPQYIKSADPVTYDDKGNVVPLSERFNEGNEDIRWSVSEDSDGNKLSVTPEEDQAYMDAVNKGDMKTAQRMVDEEAKKRGYNSPLLFHGTRSFGFTRFDLSHGYDWTPTFATNNKQTAETYSGETNRGKINERSRINIDNLQGEQLLSEAKKHLKQYSDFKVMTESQKANEAEDARNGIKSEIKAFRDFIEDNKYAFDDEKMSITSRMIDALNAITEASENDDIWDSWEKYQDAGWDFKWADESLFDEFLKSVNEHSLAIYKNRIDDLTYDGTLFYNDRLGLEYVFDNQVALELDAELHKGIYSLYGNIDNMLVIDAEGSNWNQIIPPDELNLYGVQKTRDIAEEAKSLGYSGVLFKNLKDNGGETAYNGVSDVYVFFNANALKSADPVTYDDKGNVVPLSERFNEENEDIRWSVSEDSDGNKLSEGQREYFKDSKAVDENGNLLVLYHSSPEQFTAFNPKKLGRNTHYDNTAYGHFVTDYQPFSSRFGENQMKLYANIKKLAIDPWKASIKYSGDELERITREWLEVTDPEQLQVYEEYKEDDPDLTLNEFYEDLWSMEDDPNEYARYNKRALKKAGYDAVEVFEGYQDELSPDGSGEHIPVTTYAVFNSNQLKNVDNLNPTEDADIRYSIADRDDIENLGANVTEGGSITKFSVESWDETDVDELRQKLIDADYPPELVDKWIRDVNSMSANIIRNRLTYKADRTHSALKNNSEYYYTLDLSTLCAKRKLYQGTFNAIMHSEGMENVSLLPKDVIHLRALMDTMGYEVPCGICYEESRKKNEPKFAKQWLFGYKTKTTEWAGYANMEHDDPYIPTLADVLTTDGRSMLQAQHPEVLEAYLNFQKGRGSANPKVSRLHTDYRSDILNMTKGDIENVIKIGGLRIQSFSDFELPHVLDMMQAVLDMSVMGLTSQAYTKVPAFAQIFGNTGIKINLSLIGKAVDGKLVFDDKEGIDHRKAFKLRKKFDKNVGTILVGANRESILLAWADPRIDMVIPFHRSGWSKAEFKALGLGGYEDFQAYQSERYILDEEQARILTEKDKQNPKKKKPHTYKAGETVTLAMAHSNGFLESKDELYSNDYWDGNLSGKENAEKYLRLCAEQHRRPVFYEFLQDNSDGSWSLQPDGSTDGYWKSLIDFKMYDSTGKFAPQEVVKPTFNMQSANDIMQKFEGDPDNLPVADDVVKQFVKDYKGGRKYKLVDDKKIVDKNLPKIDTSKFSVSDDEVLDRYIVDRQKRIDDGEQMSFFGSLNETIPSKPKEKPISEQFYDDVIKVINEIRKQGAWSGKEITHLLDEVIGYQDFKFIERLNDKDDDTAETDFANFLTYFTDEDMLRGYNWYFSKYRNDKYWKTAFRSGKMKFNKLIDKRIEEIKAGKAHGRSANIEKKYYTPKEMRQLFNSLNADKELDALAKKVFDCIEKNFNVRYQGVANIKGFKHGEGGTLGQAGGRTVHLNMKYFNSEAYTDQQKASTLLHESIHSVTVYAMNLYHGDDPYTLSFEMRQACEALDEVYDTIKYDRDFAGQYGLKNAKEMVAELSNPVFRSKLKAKNLYERIVDSIKRLLGIKASDGKMSAYTAVNNALETILNNADAYNFEKYARRVTIQSDGKFSVSEEDENTPSPKEYQTTIAKLEEKVADLKSEFKKTDLKTADPKQTRIQAGRLLKRHDSNLTLQNDVVDAFSKIHRLYKEKGIDAFEEASQIALDTAKQVVSGIAIIHDEGAEQQKEIREFLKDNEIIISPYIEKNMDDFASFRKKNAFRLKLKRGEVSNLDKYIYPRLQELFPTAFPDEYYKANNKEGGENTDVLVDMLRHIGDVLDNPMYEIETIDELTPEWKEYVSDIASDIMETAYGLQTKKTFADKKYEEKVRAVAKAREEALASRDRALAKQAERYETKISYLKQRNKDFKEETRENAEKKRRIAQIARIHKRLLEKLQEPKDTKHLPDGYAPLVSNVLSMFDFTTKGMEKWAERYGEPSKRYRYLDELRKRLADMSKEDSPIAESGFEIDPDIIEIIEELKADVADTDRLSDLDSATLEDIYTLFKAFEHQLNTFNKAFDENNRQTVIENRDNFISETRDKKTRKDKQGTIGWLQRQLETNNTTPEDFFHLIGGTPEKLYKSIRKGFDKHIMNVKSAMDFIKATTEGKDVKKWSENVREYTTSFNETIKLTDAQLMSIYCLSKREQAQQHMYSENGGSGIVVVPQKVGKGLKAETLDRANVVVNSSDIQKWISQLSKEQIEVADRLQRYLSEDMSKLGNETSLKLYGYKKFTEKNYFPIQSSNDWLNSNFDFKGDSPVLKNTGMTKALNKHASNPIVIDDIFTVATKHISTMSLYNSLVPSLTDFQRFWNSKDKDHNTTVQKEFIRVYGEPAYKYVENFMGDLNGAYKRGFEVEGVDKLMSKYKQASIGLNLRVLFQQPTAVARAGAVMNPIYITKALGASTTTLKQNLKDMREHCPIALWKSWGFYNTDLARDMRSIMMDEKTISDNFSKAYGIADDLTWSVIFKAVRYEVEAQNKNLEVGSDEYWEKVNERASEVFDRTQVVDSPFHRSQNMRAKDNLSKMVTAFMAEPTKTYNMLKTELTLAKREIQSGQKAQGIKRASRVVQVFVTNALLVSASSAVIDALRGVGGSGDDDKDKNWFERFLAHWWTNTKDNINPLGLLPVFKDVQSVVQGYDVTRMDMQAIGRMVKSLQYMGEYIKAPEESKYTFKNEAHYLLQQSAYLVGLPLANLERDTRGIAFSIAEAVGYDDLFFEEAKFKYQVNDKTKSMWTDMYLDAKYKGNTALAKKIKDYITSNDAVTEEYIEEREKKYKKDNKSASQQHAYDSSIQTLETSPIWNTASEDNKEYYTGILENLSVGIENQSTEYVTKLAKNGLTNEQVILYKLALKKVDKPSKNGNYGSYTNAEKEDAIRLLERYYNLTQAQKDTLMGK